VNVRVTIEDSARPALARLREEMGPEVLNRHIGRAEERLFKDHIGKLPANKMGRSTGFWADAARGTHAESSAERVTVVVSKLGFRQRVLGGTIKAVNGKYLTIPARAEFYGSRARAFTNLRFVMFRSGTAALVIGDGGAERVTSLGASQLVGGKKGAAQTVGMVAYWLKKEVKQKPDPGVIPSEGQIVGTARDAIAAAVRRSDSKGGKR
jgi:hypothetical protein